MVRSGGVEVPNRSARTWTRQQLERATGHRTDAPDFLGLDDIQEATALFQPRFDSIAFAPGRSGSHVARLGQVLKRGRALDPVTVVSFGQEWFLVDGHHRLAAYRAASWGKPIPVQALHSDTVGDERIAWAVELSLADNGKNRLSMSPEDKADAAWRMTVHSGATLSKLETADRCDVATSTIGNMRRVVKALRGHGVREPELERLGWRHAQSALKNHEEAPGSAVGDWDEKRARILARKLAPVMEAHPSALQLAAALEAYEPGIVLAMYLAQETGESDGDGDGDG